MGGGMGRGGRHLQDCGMGWRCMGWRNCRGLRARFNPVYAAIVDREGEEAASSLLECGPVGHHRGHLSTVGTSGRLLLSCCRNSASGCLPLSQVETAARLVQGSVCPGTTHNRQSRFWKLHQREAPSTKEPRRKQDSRAVPGYLVGCFAVDYFTAVFAPS